MTMAYVSSPEGGNSKAIRNSRERKCYIKFYRVNMNLKFSMILNKMYSKGKHFIFTKGILLVDWHEVTDRVALGPPEKI